MHSTDLHWLAGLLEGEGSFIHRRDKHGHLWLGIAMVSTDKDIVQRAHRLGGGTFRGPYGRSQYKPQWHWNVTRHKEAVALMKMLRPLMGQRRHKQIDACLKAYADKKEIAHADRTHCRHGHPYSSENTVIVRRSNGRTNRQCKICARESQARLRAKRKRTHGNDYPSRAFA